MASSFIFVSANSYAQTQEPPKFQKPAAFRYLLGVRNDKQQSYGNRPSRQARSQHAAGAQPRSDRGGSNLGPRYAGYPDLGLGNQPIGSGVKIVQMESSRRVNPIDDPFGDYEEESSANYRQTRDARRMPVRRSVARPTSYNAPVQQESILRRPANSPIDGRRASDRNSSFTRPSNSTPNSFSLDPPMRRSVQEGTPAFGNQGQAAPRQETQDPMSERNPMIQRDPMNQSPMNTIPRRTPQDGLRQQKFELNCDEVQDVILQKSIRDIALNMEPKVEPGRTKPQDCEFGGAQVNPRCWEPQTFVWTASAACSKPLYFQHIQLERYGHTRGPVIQPVLSAAHFFGNVAMAPYKSLFHPRNECMYALGYYRPGDCAPWLREPWPWPSFERALNPAYSARRRGF